MILVTCGPYAIAAMCRSIPRWAGAARKPTARGSKENLKKLLKNFTNEGPGGFFKRGRHPVNLAQTFVNV